MSTGWGRTGAWSIAGLVGVGAMLVGAAQAQPVEGPVKLGSMRAGSVLFLGNSITLHGVVEAYGWPHFCGMAASTPANDWVHRVAAGLVERTNTLLYVSPHDRQDEPGPDGEVTVTSANVLNIADVFERNYGTYDASRLAPQLAARPDIVVLQCGENTPRETFDAAAYRAGLRRLLGDLEATGCPTIFVTSQILGGGGELDVIKQEVCAEAPARRIYVDLSAFGADPTNLASAEPYYSGIIVGHPGDKGMTFIADGVLGAMLKHAGCQ